MISQRLFPLTINFARNNGDDDPLTVVVEVRLLLSARRIRAPVWRQGALPPMHSTRNTIEINDRILGHRPAVMIVHIPPCM